jgi:hypothetical protein
MNKPFSQTLMGTMNNFYMRKQQIFKQQHSCLHVNMHAHTCYQDQPMYVLKQALQDITVRNVYELRVHVMQLPL